MPLSFRTLAPWHRRLAVIAGVALGVWIVSALVMLLPWSFPPGAAPEPIAFDEVALSPAGLAARLGPPAPSELTLRMVDGVPVYALRRDGGALERFDARSGEPFVLAAGSAAALAARVAGPGRGEPEVETFDAYTAGYANGELPVARVVFPERPSVYWFVDPDGGVRRSTRWQRTRKAFDDLHRFGQLSGLVGEPGRRGALLGFSLLALATIASGYWLWWIRRSLRRRGARATSLE